MLVFYQNEYIYMQTQTIKNKNWKYKLILKPEITNWQIVNRSVQFGLYVLGTEKHESRRIDNQLRGRSGRQWDSGVTQFFVALDDEIMRKMWWDKIQSLARMAIPENELADLELTQSQFTDSIIRAQKQMEAHHFSTRKHLFDYDSVINKQRIKIYKLRDEILEEKINAQTEVKSLIPKVISYYIDKYNKTGQDSLELIENVNQTFGTNIPNLESKDPWSIESHLIEYLTERFDNLLSQIDNSRRNFIIKYIYLDNIDKNWINHIDDMQHLREKVGLYGYAQQDPVIMYKQEWYELFQILEQTINTETLANIYRIDPNHINNMNLWNSITNWATTNSDQFETENNDIYDMSASSQNYMPQNNIEIISANDYQKTQIKREPRPNDKVSVMYKDGRMDIDVKFKKIEEDLKSWLCKLV